MNPGKLEIKISDLNETDGIRETNAGIYEYHHLTEIYPVLPTMQYFRP